METSYQSTVWARAVCISLMLAVPGFAAESAVPPLNFINDVAPILTKATCNSGGCHAKAVTGQRGFRLSLLG
ncbi:MAG TPA: hypothetical protein VK968_16565, partial [Roseimicrobium sp.]|nr:hypothetical protein [Roseimicrobium sp.]